MKQPDPKMHFRISIVKSVVRILAGATIMGGNLLVGGALIIFAEVLGVIEEMV